jgi:hypothetical protein
VRTEHAPLRAPRRLGRILGTVTIAAVVEPVRGEHLERLPLGAPARQWRRVVNLAAVAKLRALPTHRHIERRPAPRYPKIFVVGCGRSGTSWVQSIVAARPGVITTQESHAYEVVYGNVERRGHRGVGAWAKVLQRHDLGQREARWVGLHWWIDRRELCSLIGAAMAVRDRSSSDVAEDVIEAIFDGYFFAHGGSADHVLLEKTPGHLDAAQLILRRYPEAKVVEVLRDGRDVCVSLEMQALTVRWPPRERERQIRLWMNAVRRGIALRADTEVAARVHLVRYEDLKADPHREIARLYDFCGFDTDAAEIDQVADRTDFRHHEHTGAGRHTRRGEVGDWRNHFTPDDEELFRSTVGELFELAGYRY